MKRLLALAVIGSLTLGLIGAAHAAKTVRVFEDPVGDAGVEGGNAGHHPVPGLDQAGLDLVSGDITRVGKNLEFKVTSAGMPTTGSLPEGARFLWHFNVDGEKFRLMAKSQDIGKPEPINQQGTDRIGRIDLAGHFRLETCSETSIQGLTVSDCTVVEYLDGTFDPASKSFTVTVPLKAIGAAPGSNIGPDSSGTAVGCPICWIGHTAERSFSPGMIIDAVDPEISLYRVPKK